MKKLLVIVLSLLSVSAWAQSGLLGKITDRFSDPEKGHTVFIEKGYRSVGISGGFRSFQVGGDSASDAYTVLSILQVGAGKLNAYNVSPRFSYFVADDVSLGVRLDYSGYNLDSDLSLFGFEVLDWRLVNNTWGASFTARKYLSFFGSRTIGLFGEARLFGNYGFTNSTPYEDNTPDEDTGVLPRPDLPANARYLATDKARHSNNFSVGLKLAVGAAIRLKDYSSVSISLPIVGAAYSYTRQINHKTDNKAHVSSFNLSRSLDFLGIQVGYTHYIKSSKKK